MLLELRAGWIFRVQTARSPSWDVSLTAGVAGLVPPRPTLRLRGASSAPTAPGMPGINNSSRGGNAS